MTLLAKNIEYLLKKKGINAYQLQDKSDIAQSTTFRIINGDTKSPSSKTLQKYADYFGVSEADLRFEDLAKQEDGGQSIHDNFTMADAKVRRIPVLNYVQAGEFCEYYDDAITDDYELTYGDYPPNIYWVVIEGLSMVPDFNPKDMALINADLQPSAGDYVIAKKAGSKAVTFKKFRAKGFDEATGKEYCHLVPSNPDFPIIDSRYVDFEICGVAIEHKTKLK